MPPRRRTDPEKGHGAWLRAQEAGFDPEALPKDVLSDAVRYSLEELATRHPGRSVEVRVPPYGAVQGITGPSHKRGTPPNVFETDAATWLSLAAGELRWDQALDSGAVRASGQRADLSPYLPMTGL